MKVLVLSATDITGGAGMFACRLHHALRQRDIESEMWVSYRKSKDPRIKRLYGDSKLARLYVQFRSRSNRMIQNLQITENHNLHSANFLPSGLHHFINRSGADVVHIHNINGEMISVPEIAKIKKPVIWTLHDMWSFSGCEHYEQLKGPARYKEGYHRHNRPPKHRGVDLDRWNWKRKRYYWRNLNARLVTPSRWLSDCVQESVLFKDYNVERIPYGLPLDTYKPLSKKKAQNRLNFHPDAGENIILFGAARMFSDRRKGGSELQKALTILRQKFNRQNIRLLTFGRETVQGKELAYPAKSLGFVKNTQTMVNAYSTADVMVVPSIQENLPNTALEALACGTPVVAFDIGGLSDIVDHNENGYLAEPYNESDLARGIDQMLQRQSENGFLAEKARKKAENKFDIKIVAGQYTDLYRQAIQ